MSIENLPPECEAPVPGSEPLIRLDLTPSDCDLILSALGMGAYDLVEPLITKIRAQGLQQAERLGVSTWLATAPVDGLVPN